MAVMEIDQHARLLTGLVLKRLADDHSCGDVELFASVFAAWLGWVRELECPGCERRLIDLAQDDLAAAQRRHLH